MLLISRLWFSVAFGYFGEPKKLFWNGALVELMLSNTSKLKKMAGVSKQYNIYKPMRTSQILTGKKQVAEVIRDYKPICCW